MGACPKGYGDLSCAQRRNLQLVFLNGCSTRAQAAGLLDAGVAAQ